MNPRLDLRPDLRKAQEEDYSVVKLRNLALQNKTQDYMVRDNLLYRAFDGNTCCTKENANADRTMSSQTQTFLIIN